MCQDHHNRGISLKDKKAHSQDHKNWSRRSFLQNLGLTGGAGIFMGGYSLSAMHNAALLPALGNGGVDDRILVLIRLKGGNDGLNTIIPLFDYGTYASNRPTIAVPQNNITNLSNAFGIPNTMQSLMPLWNDGAMKVINSVGYDNHNLSHFTSSDIWNSGNQNIEMDLNKSGWLGRYILNQKPDYLENLPDIPAAIKVSSGSNITYHNPNRIDLAVNFNSTDRLQEIAETGLLYDTENLPDDCYYGEQVGFLRSLLNVTANYAGVISDAFNLGSNDVSYESNELSRQLSIVARLIKGRLGTKLYMVTLNGFDTHEQQNQKHPQLMNELSTAVNSFYADLQSADVDQNVLSMTFSEFGRRVRENSGGTDHGTAAPVMLFGPSLNGNGILGQDPDMDDLDNTGNMKHGTDFRSIYATVLEYWLCLDPMSVDNILGNDYQRLDNMGIDCMSVSTSETPVAQNVSHKAIPQGDGSTIIEYTLDRPGLTNVTIYSFFGHKISTLQTGYQNAGTHKLRFINKLGGARTAPLVYKIHSGNKVESGKFIVTN